MFVKIFLARSLRRQNRLDEAAAFLDEVETAVDELNSRRLELNYLEERAALLQDRGDYEAAEQRANRALEIADRVGIPLTRFRIYRLLSLIQQAAGRNDEARHSYEAAAEDLEGILADFSREELREGFLKRPQIAAFRGNRP
jgi:tetratricopeptide (TPR) repeat protein